MSSSSDHDADTKCNVGDLRDAPPDPWRWIHDVNGPAVSSVSFRLDEDQGKNCKRDEAETQPQSVSEPRTKDDNDYEGSRYQTANKPDGEREEEGAHLPQSQADSFHDNPRPEGAISANEGVKQRRLSNMAKSVKTLTTIDTASVIQPGRHRSSLWGNGSQLETMHQSEQFMAVTIPKTIEFFGSMEVKLIAGNVIISTILTAVVLYLFPESWKEGFKNTNTSIAVLGSFLSFALVFRTQSCYSRWWEARTMWGRMTSACVQLSGQARAYFGDEDLVDRFLLYLVVFPYASKAVLRGNQLKDEAEEGPRFLQCEMLTYDDLDVITQHGSPPFVCLDIMRRTTIEALQERHRCVLPPTVLNGAFLAMDQTMWELNLNFGACLKLKSTRMPATYTIFMRSFVLFYFAFASLNWAPTIKWLTPIVTGFMVFLINTVIIIGDLMMRPFELQWAGLPLQKYCVIMEKEIIHTSTRHVDIDSLFTS